MANAYTTAVATTGGGTRFTQGILEYQSREILFKSQPLCRFAELVHEKRELLTAPGLRINFLKYHDLGGTGNIALTELTPMESNAVTGAVVGISIREIGYKLAVTELLLQATFTDLMADATQLLGHHYAKATDREIRDVAYTSPNIIYAGGHADRTDIVAGDTLDWDLVQDCVEYMAIAKAPMYEGDRYIMLIHPSQAKKLRQDSKWIDAYKYTNTSNLFTGEIGRIENVGFVVTTMIRQIKATTGQNWTDNENEGTVQDDKPTVNTYQAVMLADHAIGHAIGKELELRDDGIHDMGRIHQFGYYGMRGFGLIEPDHVLIVETA